MKALAWFWLGILTPLAIALLVLGLWQHDFREILASISVAAIWPLISREVAEVGDEYMWAEDDELARSA